MGSSSGQEGKGSQAKNRDEVRDEERREQEHRQKQKQKQEEQQGLVLWVRGGGRGAYVWLEY